MDVGQDAIIDSTIIANGVYTFKGYTETPKYCSDHNYSDDRENMIRTFVVLEMNIEWTSMQKKKQLFQEQPITISFKSFKKA